MTEAGPPGDGAVSAALQDGAVWAALRRIIPADADADADADAAAGTGTASVADEPLASEVRRLAGTHHTSLWERSIAPGRRFLTAEAAASTGKAFEDLDADGQHALLRAVETGQVATSWEGVDPRRFFAALVRVAQETFYGTRDSPAWAMIGYQAGPSRSPGADVVHTRLPTTAFAAVAERYDVVVVGSGAGGGVAAKVLTEAGTSVLIVERGQALNHGQVGRDHLANHRYAAHGHNTGPDAEGNPRVYVDDAGGEHVIDKPWSDAWSNNAMTVGGGTRVYQGMAWRFLPEDFELASRYGVPDGSSLADWPISYDDLEPYYTRAEWALGVCGDGGAHRAQGHRSRPYPMEPFALDPEGEPLAAGADELGLSTGPVPLLINSAPRRGRARCVGCGECVGFACPSEAKNGSWNTVLADALLTGRAGRAELVTGARATRITVDGRGRWTGWRWSTGPAAPNVGSPPAMWWWPQEPWSPPACCWPRPMRPTPEGSATPSTRWAPPAGPPLRGRLRHVRRTDDLHGGTGGHHRHL